MIDEICPRRACRSPEPQTLEPRKKHARPHNYAKGLTKKETRNETLSKVVLAMCKCT